MNRCFQSKLRAIEKGATRPAKIRIILEKLSILSGTGNILNKP